ncbi:trigger factor [Notoacmeibacter sp. MSK16QG-6]|uniref:trigger factor n=1 Tax=Notoacmeibacter sp. MSK16QG-6 TaxID=2957982 RepID=UPI00209F87EF|nr:trigger factor [Notoacmeibacter sp. MSK16QG-6]MCP1199375.1 trigger factor [Notoacmeibacter sp. MSK16QG-6]
MQVTETLNEGLKREIKVVVPAADMESRLMERINDSKDKVRLKGFRPGKVPTAHLKRMYGKSFMAEIVNDIVTNSTRNVIAERDEKAAMQPEIVMTEDQEEAEKILAGEQDFAFELKYEIVPQFELQDVSDITIERPVVEVADEEIEDQVKQIAQSARSYEEKEGAAEDGDRVTLDYLGKIDGEPFDGGKAEGANLVLGSGNFIPGFEEQLVGLKKGDEKTITVTFPEEYGAEHLAGKEATFDVTIHEVAAAQEQELNDELAKKLGLESMDKLREIVRDQVQGQYGQMTRQKVKRSLLDALDERYQFETPEKLTEAEFNNIWNQVTADLERNGKSFEDEDTTEEAAREDYQKLAARRVRLGLVLSAIGEKAEITVTEQELQQALGEQLRRYPGQEQQVMEFYRNTPDAVNALRAPIFEEKVIDHLMEEISVNDKTVSKEELMAEEDEEFGSSTATAGDDA